MGQRVVAMKIANSRTPEQWAGVIREKWQDNVKGIFETALYVETAHEELGPAVWLKMVCEELKWSKRTGYKLLSIAQDEKLAGVTHASLPASWETLYELTRLTAEQFATGVDSGVIHAGMERKDIKALKPPKPPKEKSKESPSLRGEDLVKRRTFEARQVIVNALREMVPEDKLDFISLLRFQLDDLEATSKEPA